eukprot:c11779_g1_i1.p1 GENE.c11779_g1_i1~~c11779_g1_i1.p1  ORF type:complete len:1020 (-),score=264.88 c11779_g1_i1:719-3778(-)
MGAHHSSSKHAAFTNNKQQKRQQMSRTKFFLSLAVILGLISSVSGLVIGVDLGTRYFKIGLLQAGKPYHVILNVESQRRTSTAVSFVSGSEREFGDTAQGLATRIPEDTVLLATTLLGRSPSDESLHWFNQSLLPTKWVVDEARGSYRVELNHGLSFTAEEIVAMILEYGQALATTAAGVPIVDAVIAVPPFYTHQQRVALIDAAKIAGITVTGLINDNTAVALLYGVEKEKEFKKDGKTAEEVDLERDVLFFDMGATSTRATVVRYGSTLSKLDKKGNKTVGEYWIKSVAWDESLGALAFDNLLVESIATTFNKKRGVTEGSEKDVRKVPKAVAKMRKAAEKAKEVLSTIGATTVSIEGLLEDTDFRMEVSNAELATQGASYLERVAGVVKRALEQAGVEAAALHSVELVGGGARMPIVQSVLKELLKKDLGASLNGDDSVALGATLYAAKVSPAHRMREFVLRDASPYSISVDVLSTATSTPIITREIFSAGGKMPVNKRLTLSRNDDFDVLVRYSPNQVLPAGISDIIARYGIEGVASALEKLADEIATTEEVKEIKDSDDNEGDDGAEGASDGAKKAKVSVSLHLSSMGTVELARHEASVHVFIKEEPAVEQAPDTPAEDATVEVPASEQPGTTDDKKTDEAKSDAKEDKNDSAGGALLPEQTAPKTKLKHIKTTVSFLLPENSIRPLSDSQVSESAAALAKLAVADRGRRELEASKNEFETHVYGVRNFLTSGGDVDLVCSEEEKEKILELLTAAEDWLYDDGASADLLTYQTKLSEIKTHSEKVRIRFSEMSLRPEAVAKARERIYVIIDKVISWNATKPWINETDKISLLNRTIAFEEWLNTTEAEQSKLSLYEDPVLSSGEVEHKLTPVENKFQKLAKTPKPLPPRAPLNGTKSWGNYTKSGNRTKTSQDGTKKAKTAQGTKKGTPQQEKQKQKKQAEQKQKAAAPEVDDIPNDARENTDDNIAPDGDGDGNVDTDNAEKDDDSQQDDDNKDDGEDGAEPKKQHQKQKDEL